jgi:hypothetical protein
MSTEPDDRSYQGEGKTIQDAAEDAAKKVPATVQDDTYLMTIYAQLSGEHNPIHGYIVQLSPGHP